MALSVNGVGDVEQSGSFTCLVDPSVLTSELFAVSSSTTKLPTTNELQTAYKDRKKLKRLLRVSDWPANHEIRCSLWLKLCSCIEDCKLALDGYHDSLHDIFGSVEGDSELYTSQLPSFVDSNCLVRRHLSDFGVKTVCRILCVISHERPDVTYSPTLFTLACLLLHYVDEATCYACLRVLIISKQRYVAQTNISYIARSLVLRELARKHVRGWYVSMTKKGVDVDAVLSQWQWWILKDLNFSYLVRVMDCYLYEGPKILYRVALAILILYHKHNTVTNYETVSDIESDIRRFVANIPVSCTKLFKTAFGIRGMSRAEMRKLIVKKELYVQSKQNAAVLSANIPPSQSTGSLGITVTHTGDMGDIVTQRQPARSGSLDLSADCSPIFTKLSSLVLSQPHWRELYKWVPRRFTLNEPKMVFSTSVHGSSLSTLYNKVAGHEPTFIVIKTDKAEVFGAFCSVNWSERKSQQKSRGYFGTGETFVCQLSPSSVKFPWVGILRGENTPYSAQLFQSADNSQISIGGGGGCAICVDESLLHGRSERCDTFNNSSLVSGVDGQFTVVILEVWAFD